MKTFYDILKISEDASLVEIENSYKKLKLYYSNYLNDEEKKFKAQERIKEINLAFEILGNEEKRISYDKDLISMRQNELMNNLQNNTNTYNDEHKKQEEKKIEEEKRIQEEKIKKENEQKINYIKGEIGKQLESQTQKFKQEELERERIQKLEEARQEAIENIKEKIYKEYKKKSKIEKLNNMSPIRKFIRTIFATIIVLGVIIIIFQIPAVKQIIKNIDIIEYISDFNNN